MTRMTTLLPLLLLAGCGSGGGADDADQNKADPVALVRLAPATIGATAETTILYGMAEPSPDGGRTLTAPVETIVDRILAPNGTAVAAGQIVATLDPSRATAADLAKASADAASADAGYARATRLRADGLASDADVETARTAAATAQAARALLAGGRHGLAVRAPIAGTVEGLTVKSGDQIAAGAAIAGILVPGRLRARFGVDPALAPRVRLGQPLTIDAAGGAAGAAGIAVPVSGIDTQVDPATRLAAVYARLPQGVAAAPGEALRASLALGARPRGLTIPYAALLDDGGRSYVFVVTGGVAHRRDVLPGNSAGDRIEIRRGLAAGDSVVTEGATALDDGMAVRLR